MAGLLELPWHLEISESILLVVYSLIFIIIGIILEAGLVQNRQ